jgi:hypothetical protein
LTEVLELGNELKLPDEPDPLEKKYKQLERENIELKTSMPRLCLKFAGGNDRLTYTITPPTPVTPAEIEHESKLIRLKHKKLNDIRAEVDNGNIIGMSKSALFGNVTSMSEDEINEFDSLMDKFYDSYAEWLRKKAVYAELVSQTVELSFTLWNEGSSPATDIDVSLHFPDGFLMVTKAEYPAQPREPQPPQPMNKLARAMSQLGRSIAFPNFQIPSLSGLDNVSGPGLRRTNSYEANYHVPRLKHEDFGHLGTLLVIFSESEPPFSFPINYRIHAANVPKSIEGKLQVILKED